MPTDPGGARVEELLDRYLDLRLAGERIEIDGFLAQHSPLVAPERERMRRLAGLLEEREDIGCHPFEGSSSEPDRVGPYRILRELGRGGQGIVFLAEDTRFARRVALKVLARHGLELRDEAQEREASARLRREAEIVSRLDHPGICVVHEMGMERNDRYIAMRFVEGETLAKKIAAARAAARGLEPGEAATPTTSSRREIERVLLLVERCARALHAAHEAGVVHRDVKPGNIMVTPEGETVLLDFGLARDLDQGATLTTSGGLLGTPAYMAPEQLSSAHAPIDRRADVYALGVTLHECLTLERPFQAPTRELLYRSILGERPPAVRSLNPAVPRELEIVLETALAKEPDQRYQTALDLAEDLRRVRAREPIRARPAGMVLRATRWVQRNLVLATTLGALFLALVAGLAVALFLLDRAQDDRVKAEGERLIAESRAVLPTNPCLALLLALEGARVAPGRNANEVLLQAIGDLRERRMLETPAQMTRFLASPDGRFLVTVAFDRAPQVWDANSWKHVIDLEGHGSEVHGLDFSADSSLLATSTDDGTCRLWSTDSWKIVHELPDPDPRIAFVSFVADGRSLVTLSTGSPSPSVRLWDLEREIARIVEEGGHPIHRLRASPCGERFLVVGTDGVRVWEIGGDAPRKVFERPNPAPEEALDALFHPDGRRLLLAGHGEGGLWDLDSGKQLCAFACERPGLDGLAFSPDGRTMLAGPALFECASGRPLGKLEGFAGDANFSPDGARIVGRSSDGAGRLWDAATGAELAVFKSHDGPIHVPRFARSGRTVITASLDGTLREWNIEPEGRTTISSAPDRFIGQVFAHGGRRVACETDHGVRVIDLDSPSTSLDLALESPRVACLDLAQDGGSLLVAEHAQDSRGGGSVRTYDAGSGAQLTVFPHPSGIKAYDARFSADCRRVVTACDDGKARLWDARSGALERELSGHTAGVRSAAFDASGERIITAAENRQDATVRIWDAGSGAQLALLATLGEQPIQARLSPDGRQAVAACWRGMVCVWSVASGELRRWRAHPGSFQWAAFSPDGTRILTASGGGVRLWNAETLDEVMTVEAHRTASVCGVSFDATGRWIVVGAGDGIRQWPVDPWQRAMELAPRALTAAERERYGLAGQDLR